jgi:hypothetical protein
MEHIIDNTHITIDSSSSIQNSNNNTNKGQNNQIITREEREICLKNNYKRAFSKTLENLILNKSENNKDNNSENLSVIEDDNFSVASSKILSVGNKSYKNTKLPLIYGTKEFDAMKYLGLVDETIQLVVNNLTNSTTQNVNVKNNNSASDENLNTRSQSDIYNNSYDVNTNNRTNPVQNQNKLNEFNNYNNNRNYDQNYDYKNTRPSMVSEFAKPDFQQLMDQEISLGFNKKTSMEFNLMNINNNINFMRNQSFLLPKNNHDSTGTIVSFGQESNGNNQLCIPKNMKPLNIKGKVPKAPPLPAHLLQTLKRIPTPKHPSQAAINSQNMNISVKLSSNANSEILRNPNSNENKNFNNLRNEDQSDPSSVKNQENNRKPLLYKENLNLMLAGREGMTLVMHQPSNSVIDNNSNDRDNFCNDNNFDNNFNQNIKNNYNGNTTETNINRNDIRSPIVKSNSMINKFQLPNNNTFEKQKTVNLNNFVKKSTLFEVEEDDEEDNTGLFKRATSNNINLMLNKRNTQNNLNFQKEITSNLISNTNENKYNGNNSNYNSYIPNNLFNNNQENIKKQNLFSDENSIKIEKLPITPQRSILKTKGLESKHKMLFI